MPSVGIEIISTLQLLFSTERFAAANFNSGNTGKAGDSICMNIECFATAELNNKTSSKKL